MYEGKVNNSFQYSLEYQTIYTDKMILVNVNAWEIKERCIWMYYYDEERMKKISDGEIPYRIVILPLARIRQFRSTVLFEPSLKEE